MNGGQGTTRRSHLIGVPFRVLTGVSGPTGGWPSITSSKMMFTPRSRSFLSRAIRNEGGYMSVSKYLFPWTIVTALFWWMIGMVSLFESVVKFALTG